jgi:hypothetical protein
MADGATSVTVESEAKSRAAALAGRLTFHEVYRKRGG